jgi:hypothetical protein
MSVEHFSNRDPRPEALGYFKGREGCNLDGGQAPGELTKGEVEGWSTRPARTEMPDGKGQDPCQLEKDGHRQRDLPVRVARLSEKSSALAVGGDCEVVRNRVTSRDGGQSQGGDPDERAPVHTVGTLQRFAAKGQ